MKEKTKTGEHLLKLIMLNERKTHYKNATKFKSNPYDNKIKTQNLKGERQHTQKSNPKKWKFILARNQSSEVFKDLGKKTIRTPQPIGCVNSSNA